MSRHRPSNQTEKFTKQRTRGRRRRRGVQSEWGSSASPVLLHPRRPAAGSASGGEGRRQVRRGEGRPGGAGSPPLPLREVRPGRKRAEGSRWRRGRASALRVPGRRVTRGRRRPGPRGRVPSSWRAWGPGGPRPRARCPSFRDLSTCRACGRAGPERGQEPASPLPLAVSCFGSAPLRGRARGRCSELVTFPWNRCGRSRAVGTPP